MATAAPIQVPTTTAEDLQRFHSLHFAPICSSYFSQTFGVQTGFEQRVAETQEQCVYDDEEDDLGYYADGTKRTLTDEQISIFRHSEIQALLRERRRQEAQREGKAESEEPSKANIVADTPDLEDEDEEEYERFLEEERKNLSKSMKKKKKKKNKKNSKPARASSEGEKCGRRIARELDDSKSGADAALDYDEAPQYPSNESGLEHELYHKPVTARRAVEYGDFEDNNPVASRDSQSSKEAKAFIWPKLGNP